MDNNLKIFTIIAFIVLLGVGYLTTKQSKNNEDSEMWIRYYHH